MNVVPLTPAQASFVEVEILGRHIDEGESMTLSEEAMIAALIEGPFNHSERKLLAVVPGLDRLVMDILNDLGDSIRRKDTERHGFGGMRQAQGLYRAASTLYDKIYDSLRAGHVSGRRR